ncbi:MAG TPA: glycoside hydrolase family 38 C-terminal domain-containing protein, partial [Deinococcales bacterium]|nr:glycoside hydrolase family 38 C-terminal domain-containing protein [Deinococcales bacterium]
ENGPARAIVRAELEYEGSSARLDYILAAGLPYLDVRVTLDWHGRYQLLRFSAPTALAFPKAVYETPYGSIERPTDGDEVPVQTWMTLEGLHRPSGRVAGLGLLNDAKASASAQESRLSLTLLRSPIYAHHDPFKPVPGGDYRFMDQGEQRFNLRLAPYAGTWLTAELPRRARELNLPGNAVAETYHDGPGAPVASYLSVEPSSVIVTAVKRHEDSDGLIVRAVELAKRPTTATFSFPQWGRTFDWPLGPAEILTLLVAPDGSVTEVNLLEEPMADGPAR